MVLKFCIGMWSLFHPASTPNLFLWFLVDSKSFICGCITLLALAFTIASLGSEIFFSGILILGRNTLNDKIQGLLCGLHHSCHSWYFKWPGFVNVGLYLCTYHPPHDVAGDRRYECVVNLKLLLSVGKIKSSSAIRPLAEGAVTGRTGGETQQYFLWRWYLYWG